MKLRTMWAIAGAVALAAMAGSAQALPSAKAVDPGVSGTTGVEKVHYRPYRHCHWFRGYRRCHGGQYSYGYDPYYSSYDYPYYSYGYSPGFSLFLGGGRHHRGHRR